jgi:hypothetical protein
VARLSILEMLAWASLVLAVCSSVAIAADLFRRPQHMWIMNIVWPVTALYAGPLAAWAYVLFGRAPAKHDDQEMGHASKPFYVSVGLAATHCGAGCTVGDLISEWLLVLVPALGSSPFKTPMFNAWIVDYVLAYLFGILFQYFTIAPMRHLSLGQGLLAAIKADTLTLTAWQIGMYGWMALAMFVLFGHDIPKTSPVFWFMMQLAMLCGLVTSYPVNWWLIRIGIKEEM